MDVWGGSDYSAICTTTTASDQFYLNVVIILQVLRYLNFGLFRSFGLKIIIISFHELNRFRPKWVTLQTENAYKWIFKLGGFEFLNPGKGSECNDWFTGDPLAGLEVRCGFTSQFTPESRSESWNKFETNLWVKISIKGKVSQDTSKPK